ncbi:MULTISPECIES: hypothetical protein [unclassified Paenibacillus]|uniref:hypothetical protein n=1 Tax=unclassified Paenibacillus TaxID=185978 RepID=UPI002118A065|nr:MULTISPECIES: hypothetical protein [unclassified Paenibacillus]
MRNGLSAVQEAILEGVANGIVQPVSLFAQISNQFNDLGMGDVQFWAELDELVHAEHPVIELEGGRLPDYSGNLDSDSLRYVRIRPTSLGCELLQGRADYVHVNGIKRWLGGYQAHGRPGMALEWIGGTVNVFVEKRYCIYPWIYDTLSLVAEKLVRNKW